MEIDDNAVADILPETSQQSINEIVDTNSKEELKLEVVLNDEQNSSNITSDVNGDNKQPFAEDVDLSTKWELAAVTFYANCFEKLWNLPQIFAEDIEDGCRSLCEDLASQFFLDFFIALLQSFRKSVEINRYNYQTYISRIANETGKGEMLEKFSAQNFWSLPAVDRLQLLMALCLARIDFDVSSTESKLKEIDADSIRMEPVGTDGNGRIYWHFGDTRLYRDIPPPPPRSPKKKVPPPKSKGKRKFGSRGKKGKRKNSPVKADNTVDSSILENSMDIQTEEMPVEAKWEVVCTMEEQWQSFVNDLSTSKNKKDADLGNILKESIMPILPEIFAEKEKVLKKRALMFAPRRQSYRLEEKRKAYVDANRFISYIASDGQILDPVLSDSSMHAHSDQELTGNSKRKFRRAPLTNEEAMEQKRLMEEEHEKSRQQAASARANRASRRAEGIPAISLEYESQSVNDEKEDDEEEEEMNFYRMEDIIQQIAKHQDASPFAEPVPVSLAPDYYDIIKEPMDLSAMAEKLLRRKYNNINDFIADFEKICQNCCKYNGASNPYTVKVRRLSRGFQSLLRQNFPQAAKERNTRGFIGQLQRHTARELESSTQLSESSGHSDNEEPNSWVGNGEDSDWSPTKNQSQSVDEKPLKSSSRRNKQKQEFYNNLDSLLDHDEDRPHKRRMNSSLSKSLLANQHHQKSSNSPAIMRAAANSTSTPVRGYTQQPSVRFASAQGSQTAAILRQPTGAYWRPSIGDMPPQPVRKIAPNITSPNGGQIRSLIIQPSTVPGSTNGSLTPSSGSPVVRIKLIAAGKPGMVANTQQQTPHGQVLNSPAQGQPVTYVLPLGVTQSAQSNQAVVVIPSSSTANSPQISLARVAQVASVAQQQPRTVTNSSIQLPVSASSPTPAASTSKMEPSSSVVKSADPPSQQTFSNAFLNFVNSSKA